MEFSAKTIAELLQGEVDGNAEVKVSDVSKIEEGKTGTLSFLANPHYTPYIYTTNASVVIVSKDFKPEKEITSTLIRVADPYKAFAQLLDIYYNSKVSKKGIEQPSFISQSAKLGNDVYVGAFAYIGENVVIGNNVKIFPQVYIGDATEINDNTILHPGVKIYNRSKIGANCILHAGVVIGSDGFGFAPQTGQNYTKVPQVGNVVIEDNVEIGANTSIDRATMGSTIIRRGVKLDNLIQVAHNVEIGESTVIAALTGISGSSKIGRDCMFGGQVGIAGHISIADGTMIGAQSGVSSSIKDKGKILLGSPAFDIGESKKSLIIFKKLPELYRKVLDLERLLNKMTGKE